MQIPIGLFSLYAWFVVTGDKIFAVITKKVCKLYKAKGDENDWVTHFEHFRLD